MKNLECDINANSNLSTASNNPRESVISLRQQLQSLKDDDGLPEQKRCYISNEVVSDSP